MMPGNSKEAYNIHKTLTKTQQHNSAVIKDSSGNIPTESTTTLYRWTEYCSGLYNYELHPDISLIRSNQTPAQEAESLPVLREEVEEAVKKSLHELTSLPLSCLRMEARQQQLS